MGYGLFRLLSFMSQVLPNFHTFQISQKLLGRLNNKSYLGREFRGEKKDDEYSKAKRVKALAAKLP